MPSFSPSDEIARIAAEVSRGDASPAAAPLPVAAPPRGYLAATRTPTYGFLAALPLFVLYEVGVLATNGGSAAQVRVGADVWLKTLLAWFGVGGWAALGGIVLLIGIGVFVAERTRRPAIVPAYFGGIVGESLVYALVLAALVGGVVGALFGGALWPAALPAMAQMGIPGGLGMQLALSIGAGLYEELVFRVLLVGGLAWGLRRVVKLPAGRALLVAAVVGAVVFSAVHHLGPYGEAFTLSAFTFRFLFGLALNGVFLVRGFALAAWTHALYDVLVVSGWFS